MSFTKAMVETQKKYGPGDEIFVAGEDSYKRVQSKDEK
jgi:hypothetical protein